MPNAQKKQSKAFFFKTPLAIQHFLQKLGSVQGAILGFICKKRLVLFIAAVSALALAARVALWPNISGDFTECLHPWMDEIRQGGAFRTLHLQIGNYTSPYHYLMAFMAYIPGLNNLLAIKIPSTIADFCLAASGAYLALLLTHSKLKASLCYAALLCLPTVLLNSAAWAQCDAMYTCLVLLCICAFIQGKKSLALLLYGFALAVKLQAIFVLPALLIYFLCEKLNFLQLLAAATGYFLAFLPAIVASGNFSPLFRAYAMQTKINALSSNIQNFPSLLTGITEDSLALVANALLCLCAIALGCVALYSLHKKHFFTTHSAFILLFLCCILVPYLLPAMKDRYYYMAEVLAVIYAFYRPQRWLLPALMQLVSLPAYTGYLWGGASPFGQWFAIAPAYIIFVLLRDLRAGFYTAANTGGPHAAVAATQGKGG